MSDNYDAGVSQQITESNNNDDLCSEENSAHGSSHSENMSSADKTSSDERKKFSCYDVISSEWLESAKEYKNARIYVHHEILDWIVLFINVNILNEKIKATVEEVFHHNLNGQVYLIKFYIKTTLRKFEPMWPTLRQYIEKLKDQLKYKCVWEKRPTYFLKIDSGFDERETQIISALQKLNLHESFKPTSLDVNWMYIPKIQKYEFSESLTDDQTNQIDLIFKNMSKSLSSLFICKQFQWHNDRVVGDFVSVDTLAMDICAEEWSRHDLFKEFELENLLDLDLAYKDYRNEFLNGYMEKYIHKLLVKLMPKLFSDVDEKLKLSIDRLDNYARHYFISKFYNKIIFLGINNIHNILSKHDIPQHDLPVMEVDLKCNKPTPDELSKIEDYSIIEYNISNYYYFSDSLFRTLLIKPNVKQRYRISFGTDFRFRYEKNNKISPQLCQFRTLSIELIDCSENNAGQLAIFIKYIFSLGKDIQHRHAEIRIRFKNCVLDDYSFFESIDRSIDAILFEKINFTSSQFKLLSRLLTQQKMVYFYDCNITDTNVMTLLENIDLDNLNLNYCNACTPAVFFMMAEHLMGKKSYNNPIEARRFQHMKGLLPIFRNMNLDFERIEFFNTGDQIIIRDIKSKKIKSLFCTTEQNSDDESFDPIYNIYNE